MASIERINLKVGQTPTESDWESMLNRVIDYINGGIPPADLQKNEAGRLVVNIAGDATTVGGLTPEEIAAGDFPEIKKTFVDLILGKIQTGLVLDGGVATKNVSTANQLDITACIVLQKEAATGYINRVELPAASKFTTIPSTTYYLAVQPDAVDYYFANEVPTGDYVLLAEVLTDGAANISSVIDQRDTTTVFLGGYASQLDLLRSVDGVTSPNGDIDLISGGAIVITPDNNAKTITISETHSVRLDNPHQVNAAQVGAVAKTGDTMTGLLTITNNGVFPNLGQIQVSKTDYPDGLSIGYGLTEDGWPTAGTVLTIKHSTSRMFQFCHAATLPRIWTRQYYNTAWGSWESVWSNQNQGSGSGLDADVLDGQHAADLMREARVIAALGM